MKSKIDTPWALRNNSLKLSLIRSEGKDIGETFATIKVISCIGKKRRILGINRRDTALATRNGTFSECNICNLTVQSTNKIKISLYFCFMPDKLGKFNWYSYLSARGYLPLIWKYSVSHIHVVSVHLEERLPLAKELSLENLRILIYVSTGFTLFFIVLLLFFYQSPSSSLYMVFDPSSSNIDEVHSINPFASVFVLETFHHKD